ncbi:MAG: LamG domain-containing protein [Planctomycetota bacterium]|jgi:hypothetical protein
MRIQLLVATGLLTFVNADDSVATDGIGWPQWRGPDRTDVSRETGLLKSWPDGGPTQLWLYRNTGTGYSGPAVTGGRLFIMGGRAGFWLHESERVTHTDDKSRLIVEIDTLEQYGHWPNKHTCALHIWDRSGQGRGSHSGLRTLVPGMTEGCHTYGQMVTPQFIIYYYDGVEIRREPTPESLDSPLYLVAELALGPGWPLDRTPSPVYMYVDYIRVYGKK